MKLRQEPMPTDLPILNAEEYGTDGADSPVKNGKVKKAQTSREDEGPRKRAKTTSTAVVTEVTDEGDEKSKRARGRPRVDTKDQTAAERRRTQIRLAQRAYRSRKENAIQTLEKTVSKLQDSNEEMSNAFMKLRDLAVSKGILDLAPDFAREFRSTTEKFLALTRRASDEDGSEATTKSPSQEPGDSSSASSGHEDKNPAPAEATNTQQQQQSSLGTPAVSYDLASATESVHSGPSDAVAVATTQPVIVHAPLGYEVITMPTLENASFPFDFAAEHPFPDFFNGNNNDTSNGSSVAATGSHPSTTSTYSPPSIPSPYSSPSLSLPSSFAYNEATFGRRIHRSALQNGWQLINMPNPPPDMFAKVFGFCLLFEPIESIRNRLGAGLANTRNNSMNWWSAPFWALGGAGQHQFDKHQQQQHGAAGGAGGAGGGQAVPVVDGGTHLPAGNEGTIDVGKHNFDTNFRMGPFDAKTMDARDRCLDPRMRITLPGFEGEFYDPEEVELFLRSKGVMIRPGQDYVTAEVDAAWFEDLCRQEAGGVLNYNGGTPGYDPWESRAAPNAMVSGTTWELDSASGNIVPSPTGAGNGASLGGISNESGWVFPGNGGSLPRRRRIVTLDVARFINEIVHRAVCLQRSPGFRPEDINHSFWLATQGGDILDF